MIREYIVSQEKRIIVISINNENNKDDIDNDNHIKDDKITIMNKEFILNFDVPTCLAEIFFLSSVYATSIFSVS